MVDAPFQAVLFDVDGTLVDSNDAHAHAWRQALREHGVEVAFEDVRRLIGMGGDKVLPELSGHSEHSEAGAAIADRRGQIFTENLLPTLTAFADAAALVAALKARGYRTVAASSAKGEELTRLLEIAGATPHFDATTSSDDANASKPDPDIVLAALARIDVSAEAAIMIGDTPYDVEAATRAGVACVALRCGGWSDEDLAGALAIYDDPADLLARLEESPLVAGSRARLVHRRARRSSMPWACSSGSKSAERREAPSGRRPRDGFNPRSTSPQASPVRHGRRR